MSCIPALIYMTSLQKAANVKIILATKVLHGAGLRQCLEFRSLELIWTLRIHNVNCSLQGITRPKFTFLTRTIEIPNWNCFQVKEGVETETNYNSNQEAM